jgi:hypothetical protein|tara:strand:- start:179 stop:883 length:705 start_codon:yes stop_codon:yes gene_type:complete
MKHILNLFILMFLFGCATSSVEAQSGKTKVQSKIASYEAEKTLDDIKWFDGEPEGVQLIQISISENILNAYPELRDKRVGFGVTNRIIEVLEEAGRFYFVEEKEEVLNKMVQEWERSVSGLLDNELDSVGQFAQTKYFVYAELYDFAVSNQEEISRRKVKLKNTTMVGIQVRLVSVETGKYITGSGLGTSAKEGEGLLKNLDMSFDQSTVSFATTGAVITAVANVLRRMEKRGW